MRYRKTVITSVLAVLAVSVLTTAPATAAGPVVPVAPVASGCGGVTTPPLLAGVFVPDAPKVITATKVDGLACPMAHWTWGWVTGTVYLNKHETNLIAGGASLGGLLGAALDLILTGAALALGSLGIYASYVASNGSCLKFKIIPGFPVPSFYPASYSGGYCT